MSAIVFCSAMNSHARMTSLTLTVNEPSPQSPSESPNPSASKRNMPMPSPASCLQIRAAAGESLPSVNPCEKTPQPRGTPTGRSMIPARSGPVELRKVTRSAMREVYHARVRREMQPQPRCAARMPCRYRLAQQNTHHDGTAEHFMSEQVNSNAPDTAHVGSRIDPVLARSWLLV